MKIPLLTIVSLGIAATVGIAQGTGRAGQSRPASPMNDAAERYVKLVLALGQHDADYVDAYYGPPEWKQQAESRKVPLTDLAAQAKTLLGVVDAIPEPAAEMERCAITTCSGSSPRSRPASGCSPASACRSTRNRAPSTMRWRPRCPSRTSRRSSTSSTSSFPGMDRCSAATKFRDGFVIPREKLDAVFQAAIKGCRGRTLQHVKLPDTERFTVEYVTNKSWSGYNWYQGNFRSLIQVNTDLPVYVDRAVDLACPRRLPGPSRLQRAARAAPGSRTRLGGLCLPAVLSAVAHRRGHRTTASRSPFQATLAQLREDGPLPGRSRPGTRRRCYRVQGLVDQLAYAGNEAARRYLNGQIDRAAAAAWLEQYALMSKDRAAQRVRFFDQCHSYTINYNLGKDLVRRFIERQAGAGASDARRWAEFGLLSSPRLVGLQ